MYTIGVYVRGHMLGRVGEVWLFYFFVDENWGTNDKKSKENVPYNYYL